MGKVKIKPLLLITLIFFLFIGSIFILSPFPKQELLVVDLPNSFNIPINTGFEFQGKNQCAAFSTAFILRNFGQIAKGSEVYSELSYKVPISGYVLPKGIVTYLRYNGFNSTVFKGDLNTLKAKLVEGSNPLIVLVGNGFLWQHYMTFVGFDNQKGELYFFDSGKDKDENAELPGNRTMTNDYFLKWWDNGLPMFNHMYITAEKTL
ncbi:MAG TPA: hypothetical protein VN370_11625 [Desulfitobacteriaceae bacterium]|jgi:hypothetical protein|nr:hypothetical protein [Desulfitobacteriaceae bacterium]